MTFPLRIFCLLCLCLVYPVWAENDVPAFETIAPGIEFRKITISDPVAVSLLQLRCDPKEVRFSLLLAQDLKNGQEVARVRDLAQKFQPTAILNSLYFDHAHQILGHAERFGHPLSDGLAAGNLLTGFFYWDGGRAGLKHRGEALPKDVPVLFQAGPRLVWEGSPVTGLDDRHRARRSALATDPEGRVIMVCTDPASRPTLQGLAQILAEPESKGGVRAVRALNLDGGRSTQFWLAHPEGEIHLPGVLPVPAFLAVESKG